MLRKALAVLLVLTACSCHDADSPAAPTSHRIEPLVQSNTAQPNIILLLSDDQRPEMMNYMPLTQQLLAQGVKFTNAMSNTPLCCPARATILTGLYTHNHGVKTTSWQLGGGAPAFHDSSTIATWLHNGGYYTALVGKYLNGYDRIAPHVPPGWDYFAAFKTPGYANYDLYINGVKKHYGTAVADYSTTRLATMAVNVIKSTPANQPLFLMYTPFGPHAPAIPAVADKGLFTTMAAPRTPAYNEADVSDKPLWVRNLPVLNPVAVSTNDALYRNMLRSVQSLDRGVQSIINALAATGRLSNTYIVYAGDNGLSMGEHRHLEKNCAYDACLRIPMIVAGPGITPRSDASLVMLGDLAPTFAEWAGIPTPFVNGTSMVSLLGTPGAVWRNELLIEVLEHDDPHTTEGLFSGIRSMQFGYFENTTGEVELYDLFTDPYELTNRASDPYYASLVTQLSAELAILKAQ